MSLKNNSMAAIALYLLLLLCSACEHRPLEDMYWNEDLFVRIYFNEEIRNVSFGFYDESKKKPEYSSPQIMRILFYEEESGKLVTERYLHDCGKDLNGYYIQGLVSVPYGRYNVLAYNIDAEETNIKYDNTYDKATAYTDPLSEEEESRIFSSRGDATGEEVICRQPGHLFVTKIEGVEVFLPPNWEKPDTLKTEGEFPTAETIVKTYYFQFNVKGVEHVRSAVALITGMAGSKNMHLDEMIMDDEASIYFGLNNGKEMKRNSTEESSVAYATFNTFGKLPHTEGYIDITFEFKTIYETVQTETFHVTDMFETQQVKDRQWIIIDKVIEIAPPEGGGSGGGMTPGVHDWEQIEGNITI